MDRVETGIPGFDEIVGGGIPLGSSVLVSGGTGTCKTIFTTQYIYNGAKLFDEPGLFVSIETNVKNITWNMQSFNWDIRELQDKKMLNIYRLKFGSKMSMEDQIESELDTIADIVKEQKIQRLAVDSTTALGVYMERSENIRHMLFHFVDKLKELNCTALLTSETKPEKNVFSAYGVEEFVVDGVVVLYFYPPHRSIFVRKMRGTSHSKSVHPFSIAAEGITVHPKEQIIWEALK